MIKQKILGLAIIIVSQYNLSACAVDWPQWRGPNRNGLWQEEGIIQKFEGQKLTIKWRAKIANGYSGPTVANGRVYITDRLVSPTQVERVHCFNALNGNKNWSYTYECKYEKVEHRDGPRASIIIDEKRAYSIGTMGHLFCFNAEKGDALWNKNLDSEYKIKIPIWGIAASPLIEKDLIIVQIGGSDNACLVAFDKVSGEEQWRALNDPASYSAPIIIEQADKRVLVCWTGERIVGLNPLTGKLYWQYSSPPSRMIHNIVTPVFHNNYLFVSSFYDGPILLKIDPNRLAIEKVWQRRGHNEQRTDSLHCCMSTPIMQDDYIYGVDSYGELRCLDLKTGDRIWESLDALPKKRWANIHMVRNQDKIWMFNESGELIISKFSPKGFHEISRVKLINPTRGQHSRGVCWSHPAFANKHIYVRNDEELICVNLSAE